MESLAGKKEGCHDDVEFITVERSPSPGRFPAIVASEEVLKVVANSSVDLGHPAEVGGGVDVGGGLGRRVWVFFWGWQGAREQLLCIGCLS